MLTRIGIRVACLIAESENPMREKHLLHFFNFRSTSWIFILTAGLMVAILTILSNPGLSASTQSPTYTIYLPFISQSQTCPENDEQWICLLNLHRAAANLSPVVAQEAWNSSLALHTHYMLLNPDQTSFHEEYPSNPGYSESGEQAGGVSNMAKGFPPGFTTRESIKLWMKFPNHRYHVLHPDLVKSGFNLSCNNQVCFSGLNVLSGIQNSGDTYQVIYPGDSQIGVPADVFPITWAIYRTWLAGMGDADEIRLVSAVVYNQQNQSIAISSVEPNHNDNVYEYRNQVVITPVQAFLSHHTYRVEMTIRYLNQNYQRSWSFTTQ